MKAQNLLDLFRPEMDFVALGTGLGVPATRAATVAELVEQLRTELSEPGTI